MTMLPAQPLPELATRDDIAALRSEMAALVRGETQAIRGEMDQRFAAVDRQFAAVDRQFGELRGELGDMAGELKVEIARQTVTLALTLGALIVAVLGTVLTLGFTGAFS